MGKTSISSDSVRQAPTPPRIGEDDLHVAHMALQEGSPAFGEVKGPEPEKLVAHSEPLDSEGAIFEDLRPASQNFGVVATEVLEVDDDNVGRASQRLRRRARRERYPWERSCAE
jgi:hypothetical protein